MSCCPAKTDRNSIRNTASREDGIALEKASFLHVHAELLRLPRVAWI